MRRPAVLPGQIGGIPSAVALADSQQYEQAAARIRPARRPATLHARPTDSLDNGPHKRTIVPTRCRCRSGTVRLFGYPMAMRIGLVAVLAAGFSVGSGRSEPA